MMSLNKNGLICVGTDNLLYTKETLESQLIQVPNSGFVIGITIMHDGTILGVGLDNLLYIKETLSSQWKLVPNSGLVKGITIMHDGTILGIGLESFLFTRKTLDGAWKKVPKSDPVKGVSIMHDGTILGVGLDNFLYTRKTLKSQWKQVPKSGSVISVTVMNDGTGRILGVGTNNSIYIRNTLQGQWQQVPENAAVLDLISLGQNNYVVPDLASYEIGDGIKKAFPKIKKSFPEYKDLLENDYLEVLVNIKNRTVPTAMLSDKILKVHKATINANALKNQKGQIVETPSKCEIAIINVGVDITTFAFGLMGFKLGMPYEDRIEIATIMAPKIPKIEALMSQVKTANSAFKKAEAIFEILVGLKNIGLFDLVIKKVKDNLSPWSALKFTILAYAQAAAWVSTGGIAFMAKVLVSLIALENLVEDIIDAEKKCH